MWNKSEYSEDQILSSVNAKIFQNINLEYEVWTINKKKGGASTEGNKLHYMQAWVRVYIYIKMSVHLLALNERKSREDWAEICCSLMLFVLIFYAANTYAALVSNSLSPYN